MFDLCERLRIDYAQVRDIVAADERIGDSHIDVLRRRTIAATAASACPRTARRCSTSPRAPASTCTCCAAADRVNYALHRASGVHEQLRLEDLVEEQAA